MNGAFSDRHRPQTATPARTFCFGTDRTRQVKELAVLTRHRHIDPSLRVLNEIGVPEHIHVAFVIHRDCRTSLNTTLILDRQVLLRAEFSGMVRPGIVEATRIAMEPCSVEQPAWTDGELSTVDRPEPSYRMRIAVDPLRRRPIVSLTGPRHVPQISVTHRAGVIDEMQRARIVERRLGHAGTLRRTNDPDVGGRPVATDGQYGSQRQTRETRRLE